MSKLYVFGIGGTGSRVLKALTMMLLSRTEEMMSTAIQIQALMTMQTQKSTIQIIMKI